MTLAQSPRPTVVFNQSVVFRTVMTTRPILMHFGTEWRKWIGGRGREEKAIDACLRTWKDEVVLDVDAVYEGVDVS